MDDDVAGGAGAVASAGMFQVDAFAQEDVEQGLGLSVFVIGKLSVFELNCLPIDGYLRHAFSIAFA